MTLVEVMVALAITAVMMGAIVNGYIYCNAATTKDSLYMAANARAMERLEEARAARWDTSVYPNVDQLTDTNFPDEVVALDQSAADAGVTMATIKTDISMISTNPPTRRIHVDCIWLFNNGTETASRTALKPAGRLTNETANFQSDAGRAR